MDGAVVGDFPHPKMPMDNCSEGRRSKTTKTNQKHTKKPRCRKYRLKPTDIEVATMYLAMLPSYCTSVLANTLLRCYFVYLYCFFFCIAKRVAVGSFP